MHAPLCVTAPNFRFSGDFDVRIVRIHDQGWTTLLGTGLVPMAFGNIACHLHASSRYW